MSPAGQQIMQDIYHKQRQTLTPAILAEIDKRRGRLAPPRPPAISRLCTRRCCCCTVPTIRSSRRRSCCGSQRDIPKEYLVTALVSPAIGHVDVGNNVSVRDKLALVHWMAQMLRTARATEVRQRSRQVLPDVQGLHESVKTSSPDRLSRLS